MSEIPIATVKGIREALGATHVVVFAVLAEGEQWVGTHGATEEAARQAAEAGNRLKKAIGWPSESCNARPVERACRNCAFFKVDRGVFCMNGWSGDGSRGYCLYDHPGSATAADSKCHNFEPKS